MNLLLTLPYHAGDAALLAKNLAWMKELQPNGYKHSCLLVSDSTVETATKLSLVRTAKGMFENAEGIDVVVPKERAGWPQAPNFMFEMAARQISEVYRLPWLWFEPDATPLVPGWLGVIAEAYEKSARRFMGSLITSDNQENMPPIHLAGCAVYDSQAYLGLKNFTGGKQAFDIAAAIYTVPRASDFPRMQHFWGKPELPPSFKEGPTPIDPPNVLPPSFLKSGAVMFHRCKDGSLIDCLRQKAQSRSKAGNKSRKPAVPAQTVSEVAVSP